jgi:hypothetical protein
MEALETRVAKLERQNRTLRLGGGMKVRFTSLLLLLIFCLVSCASTGFLMAKPKVTLFGSDYPPKSPSEKIDVFNTATPSVPYVEIAKISCGDTDENWNMRQILIKAREIGADGIMVTGQSGSYAIGNGAYAVSQGYGITAIAIRYK